MTKPRSLISLNIVCVSAIVTGIIFSAPCFAGDFEAGCQFYNAKNYSGARSCFERAAKQYPANWLVRYYLANTLLSLGLKTDACREYEQCLRFKPDVQTEKYCRDTLSKIGGSSGSTASTSAPAAESLIGIEPEKIEPSGKNASPVNSNKAGATATSSATSESKGASGTVREAVKTAEQINAEIVMTRAREAVAKIRAETEHKLKTQGGWRVYTPEGAPYFEFNERETIEIKEDCEKRCAAIMDHAERSVAHVKK